MVAPLLPFAATLIPEILKAVPEVGKLFKDPDVSVRDRNTDLVIKTLEVVGNALNTNNPAEVVQQLRTPEGAQTVREAVTADFYELHKLSEDSVASARKFAVEYAQLKDVRTLFGKWFRITFLEFISLVFVLIGGAGGFAVLVSNTFSGEMKSAVVTLMLIGGYTGVKEFWLGRKVEQDK